MEDVNSICGDFSTTGQDDDTEIYDVSKTVEVTVIVETRQLGVVETAVARTVRKNAWYRENISNVITSLTTLPT